MHKIALLGLSALTATQLMAAAEPPLRTDLNEQIVMLPVDKNFLGLSIELETTIFKPQGDGPFPLVVINGGLSFGNPAFQPRTRATIIAEEFVARGYAVALPMPRGLGKSEGVMTTFNCQFAYQAKNNGNDLRALVGQLKKIPFIDGNRIIIAGQSYGGLNTLGIVSEDISGVQLAVNFAGGLKFVALDITQTPCNWQSELVKASGELGAKTKTESVWFYGSNDSFFPPELAVKMRDAYQKNGAKVTLVQYGDFRKDAHGMFGTQEGFDQIWWPKLKPILQSKGFPTERLYAKKELIASGYAKKDELDKLPANLTALCRTEYSNMLAENILPRAFAVSSDGSCGHVTDYSDPSFFAVQECKEHSKSGNCQLYLINDQVVWPKS